MEATKNSNVIINVLEYILQILYNSYYAIKVILKENGLIALIVTSVIGLSVLMYYLSFANPSNIMNYVQIPSIILYVFLTTMLISFYFYFSITSSYIEILKPIIKYLKLVGIIFGIYLLFSAVYFISKKIMYYGSKESVIGTLLILICVMGIIYNTLLKNKDTSIKSSSYNTYDLFIDIIFYIPCLFIDLIDYIKEDYNNTPSSTFILTGIVLCIILFFYGLPYLLNMLKNDKGIKLLKEQSELNKPVVYVSQKELREKIIQNRPLLERQMLSITNQIENQYKTYGKYFDTQAQIFDTNSLYNNRKYLSDYGIFSVLGDHPNCVNSSIKCDRNDNLLKCNGKRLDDVYNIYQNCDDRQSLFNSLFLNPKESVKIYPDSSKDNLLTLQEMCNIDIDVSNQTTSVLCISYNDISNQVINQSNNLLGKQIYACNLTYENNINNNNAIASLEEEKSIKESEYNIIKNNLIKELYEQYRHLYAPNGGVVDTLKKIGIFLNSSHYNDRSQSLRQYIAGVKQDVIDISNDIYSYKENLENYPIDIMNNHLTILGEIRTSLEDRLEYSNSLPNGDLNKFTDTQKGRINKSIRYIIISYNKFNNAINYNQNTFKPKYSELQALETQIQELRDDKYKVIYGYNDIDDVSGPINCLVPTVYEGFEGTIHSLDKLLQDKNLFGEFSDSEKTILKRAIDSEQSNLKHVIEQLKDDPEKLKEYIIAFFASNNNFLTLMDYINKYNNETNIFLDQKLSNLVQQINLRSNIHEYNYHYGISFWIFFDSSILNNTSKSDNNEGLIMNYANQPRIFYDYNTRELKITVNRHSSNENKPMYKTKNISYQRWNHFVINYNYGVLDIFVNNNLVGTINKLNPYVGKNNNIIFGSSSETLENCGICNVNYYDVPLSLSKIKEIYKNYENPCI